MHRPVVETTFVAAKPENGAANCTRSPRGLLETLADRGEQTALIQISSGKAEAWTCEELARTATRLAWGLIAAGVKLGDPIALVAPNSPQWVAIRLGIAAAGAVALPIDEQLAPDAAAARVRQAGCRCVFATLAHLTAFSPEDGDSAIRLFAVDGDGRQDLELPGWRSLLASDPCRLPDLPLDAPAVIVFTSGTTGAPKSFELSYANIAANVEAINQERLAGPKDRVVLPLPLDNIYPYVIGLLVPLSVGAVPVFPEALTGPLIAQALAVSEATVMIGVPRLYSVILSAIESQVAARGRLAVFGFRALLQLSIGLNRAFGLRIGRQLFRGLHRNFGPELRLLVSGGARLTGSLAWSLEGLGWEILGGYGLAEVCSGFTANLPGKRRIGSQGRALPGRELRIDQPGSDGQGEIQLRGPTVFAGYRDNPAANREAFTADGWFRTGDIGYLDADGFLYVTGRTKEVIVLAGGRNIFPEELEEIYGDSAYLMEIAVLEREGQLVALARPDEKEIRKSGNTRVEDVVRVTLTTMGADLPTFQRLSGFAIARAPLPRTRLGKFQRFLLPELYEQALQGRASRPPEALSPADAALIAEALPRRILAWIKHSYPGKSYDLDASLQLDLGIDSLEWVTLSLSLEQREGIRLSDEAIAEIVTLRDLLTQAKQAATGQSRISSAMAEETDYDDWTMPSGPFAQTVGRLILTFNRLVVARLFRLSVTGREHLASTSGYVFIANHASDLDPLVLAAALPATQAHKIYWSGLSSRLFSNPFNRLFCRMVRVFPVDERDPGRSLSRALAVLQQGNSLAWFPESWRSPDGKLQEFLPGIGWLLAQSGAQAIPVFLAGTFEAMPRWRRLPRLVRVSVAFGTACDARTLSAEGTGDQPNERIAEALRQRIAALGRRLGAEPD